MSESRTVAGHSVVIMLTAAVWSAVTSVALSASPVTSPQDVADGQRWIVYSSIEPCGLEDDDPSGQGLCLVHPDGTDAHAILTRLTEPKKADWSRDGTRLAFTAIDPPGIQRIWTSSPDGSNAAPIETDVDCDVEEAYPAWSPDGSRIAFMCLHGSPEMADLSIVDLATGATRTVMAGSGETNAWAPRWSPDGKALVINLEHVTDGQFVGSAGRDDPRRWRRRDGDHAERHGVRRLSGLEPGRLDDRVRDVRHRRVRQPGAGRVEPLHDRSGWDGPGADHRRTRSAPIVPAGRRGRRMGARSCSRGWTGVRERGGSQSVAPDGSDLRVVQDQPGYMARLQP